MNDSRIPARLPLLPAPDSALWMREDWVATDPFEEVSVGLNSDLDADEYSITINPTGASITAGSDSALADGRNAFAQIVLSARAATGALTGEVAIPGVVISDRPLHAWRGLMLDVARHFRPIHELKTIIEAMAIFRLNVLHLHLTDDQGWRFEVRSYPRLTEVGAWRDATVVGKPTFTDADEYVQERHGGFYTQAELRMLDDYAADFGIRIVPEIDLPGHVQAAVAAYPELGNDPQRQLKVRETWGISEHILGVSDASIAFIRDVVQQAAQVFSSPYVHIGGDEVPMTEWEHNPQVPERLEEWGLERLEALQGHLMGMAVDELQKAGKTAVVWDEALERHVPDGVVVMNWRSVDGVQVSLDRRFSTVIGNQEHLYLDRAQARRGEPLAQTDQVLTVKDILSAELAGEDVHDQSGVLGIQAQMWTEYVADEAHLHRMLFPRLVAVAERAWNGQLEDVKDAKRRVEAQTGVLRQLGIQPHD
ncbi:family 20 glycosylhydrolase [Helcobacillus sp. ACRRO]|uniref:beta-N-acetylhexosaminidase n=1 Tax=Helcobacillus sp. ACRRO TaxID=2918202 RepID=UPI001EF53872|nr:family 20 glycosylhydrolase [Helcobacillus sp. ACRRO]MCG7427051.1 family 20 glycosylhydrolase [Helcobacillus sp. ACRRO]